MMRMYHLRGMASELKAQWVRPTEALHLEVQRLYMQLRATVTEMCIQLKYLFVLGRTGWPLVFFFARLCWILVAVCDLLVKHELLFTSWDFNSSKAIEMSGTIASNEPPYFAWRSRCLIWATVVRKSSRPWKLFARWTTVPLDLCCSFRRQQFPWEFSNAYRAICVVSFVGTIPVNAEMCPWYINLLSISFKGQSNCRGP